MVELHIPGSTRVHTAYLRHSRRRFVILGRVVSRWSHRYHWQHSSVSQAAYKLANGPELMSCSLQNFHDPKTRLEAQAGCDSSHLYPATIRLASLPPLVVYRRDGPSRLRTGRHQQDRWRARTSSIYRKIACCMMSDFCAQLDVQGQRGRHVCL